ncbi:MAG: hypothetical protein Kow00120_11370 [Anaerolineae bacterium]
MLLTAAQAALEVGNVESARRMVEQALFAEPYTARAWYLLSHIVTRWEDQVACVKNALAADPDDIDARDRLEQLEGMRLTATIGPAKASVPLLEEARRDALAHYFAEAKVEAAGDPLDSPLQCPYCGVVNPIERRKCTACGREIVFAEPKSEQPSAFLKLATILAGTAAILGLLEIGTVALGQWYAGGLNAQLELGIGAALDAPVPRALFGEVTRAGFLDGRTATALFVLGVARIAAIAVAWFGAYNRWRWGYYAGVAVMVIDLAYQAIVGVSGLGGWLTTALIGLASLGTLVLLVGASMDDFAIVKVRFAVQADPRLKSADAYFRKGVRYKDAGMWALAVANFREAVGRAPQRVEYLRWLGYAYMRIARPERALTVLQEAKRLAPDRPELDELISLVQDMLAEEKRRTQEHLIEPLWVDPVVDRDV